MQTCAYLVTHHSTPNHAPPVPGASAPADGTWTDAVEAAGFSMASRTGFSGPGYAGDRIGLALGTTADPLAAEAAIASLRSSLRAAGAGLDGQPREVPAVAVVPAGLVEAPRKLLVMDVDSTLIQQEVIELLAAHAGREAEVAAVTEAAMRGELDFAASLHARVATLAGLEASAIDQVRAAVVLSPGARDLVDAFHASGHLVGVVSGGFAQILDPLAAELGLDFAIANDLGIADGVLTGTVNGDVVDAATKEACLRRWADEAGIPLAHTIAAGDGANDLLMVRAAGLGVAYNAKPVLREASDAAIDLPRLDIVRHLAGV